MSSLRSNVLAAKEQLAAGHEELHRRHKAGCSGVELCAAITDLRDRSPAGSDRGRARRSGRGGARRSVVGDCPGRPRRLRAPRRGPLQRRRPDDPSRAGGQRPRGPAGRAVAARRFRRRLVSRPQRADAGAGLPAGLRRVDDLHLAGGIAAVGRQRDAVRPLSATVSPPGAPPCPLAHGRHSRKTGWRSVSLRRDGVSCWSRTSSGRRARCATSS